MPRPKKNPQPQTVQPIEATVTPQEATTEPTNDLTAILSKLIEGNEPVNKKERIILSKWSHLTRWERLALAAMWDLPGEKVVNDRLARMAERKLNRL